MAQRKPYNPNTKYGRKKLKEEYINDFKKMPPEEQNMHRFIIIAVIVLFLLIVWIIGGTDAIMKWFQR